MGSAIGLPTVCTENVHTTLGSEEQKTAQSAQFSAKSWPLSSRSSRVLMRRCCTDAKHGESATGSAEGCGACGRRTLPLPGVLLAEDAGDASDAIEEPSCDVAEPGEPIGDDACAQQRPAHKSEGRVSRAHTVAPIEPCVPRCQRRCCRRSRRQAAASPPGCSSAIPGTPPSATLRPTRQR